MANARMKITRYLGAESMYSEGSQRERSKSKKQRKREENEGVFGLQGGWVRYLGGKASQESKNNRACISTLQKRKKKNVGQNQSTRLGLKKRGPRVLNVAKKKRHTFKKTKNTNRWLGSQGEPLLEGQ